MRHFSGVLSRDGHALGDVRGEIGLETFAVDETDRVKALEAMRRGRPESTRWYAGAIEVEGFSPTPDDLGATFLLSTDDGLAIRVILDGFDGMPGGAIRMKFWSTGAPLAEPVAS